MKGFVVLVLLLGVSISAQASKKISLSGAIRKAHREQQLSYRKMKILLGEDPPVLIKELGSSGLRSKQPGTVRLYRKPAHRI
jgi:hypothetical protein